MSRLKDADALIANMEQWYCKDCDRRKGKKNGKYKTLYEIGEAPCKACGVMDAMEDIENAPTIDAVPVVRCENCQYWQPPTYQEQEDGSTVGHCTAALNGQQTDAYWFCADGTR